jgi:hypothetical protein
MHCGTSPLLARSINLVGGWTSIDLEHNVDRLRWKGELGAPRDRRYVRVAGVAPDIDIVPFNNTLDTLLRGVLERVFFVKTASGFSRPPRPGTGHFAECLSGTKAALVPLLPSTAPVSHQQFVDSRTEGRKRRMYQRALVDLRAGRYQPEQEAELSVFVKYEKTDRTTKADPVPRVISPRGPIFNIRVGRYLAPLEKRIFKSIGKLFGHATVIKGMNAVKSATILREKWDMFFDPVAIGLDASRFDQHVSLDALIWEHDIYMACFPKRKHQDKLARLLKCQRENRCVGHTPDGTVEYTVQGTRMSGDMNTSLGNCLLMCSMIHAYSVSKEVNVQLANNGDDCVVFMERRDLTKYMHGLSQWFLNLGFNMTVEAPVGEFCELEFCQTKPIFDGVGWIMCRNPHTAIVKDSVMLKCWDSPGFFQGWLDSVGTGGLSLTGRLPVFQDVYAAFVRSGKRRKIPEDLLPWSFRELKKGVTRLYGAVHPECRASFYWAFGVTPDEQVCLEKYYQRLTVSSVVLPYAPRTIFA